MNPYDMVCLFKYGMAYHVTGARFRATFQSLGREFRVQLCDPDMLWGSNKSEPASYQHPICNWNGIVSGFEL